MAKAADYGLMLWDGESRGTLANIMTLVKEQKRVVVYISPAKSFYTLRDTADLLNVVAQHKPALLEEITRELTSIPPQAETAAQEELIPLF